MEREENGMLANARISVGVWILRMVGSPLEENRPTSPRVKF